MVFSIFPQKIQGQEVVNRSSAPFLYRFQRFKHEKSNLPPAQYSSASPTHQPIRPTLRSWGGPPNRDAAGRIVDRVPLIQGTGRTQERKLRIKWRHLTIFSTIFHAPDLIPGHEIFIEEDGFYV